MYLRATLEFIAIVTVLILILVLTSCGPYQVDVSGKVTHNFEIDMTNLEGYFQAKCEQDEPDNVENCTNIKIADFLEFMIK